MTDKKTEKESENHLHVHVHIPLDDVIARLQRIETTMAKSPEVQAMEDAVTAALNDITTDIQTLLSQSTGLSAEDKEALTAITEKAVAVSNIFNPTPGGV